MHRRSLAWLVSLLLLLAQHGALLHEIGHLSHGLRTEGAALQQDRHALESGPCLTCAAFSQVTNPAASAGTHLAACPHRCIAALEPRYAIVTAEAPTARSRGPPQV